VFDCDPFFDCPPKTSALPLGMATTVGYQRFSARRAVGVHLRVVGS
jgi:hypothetical protein